MFLTSSNNFLYLKNLLLNTNNNFKPQSIITKQNFELGKGSTHRLYNYEALINDLHILLAAKETKKKNVHFNIVAHEVFFLDEYDSLQSLLLNYHFKQFTDIDAPVIIDTNFFLSDRKNDVLTVFIQLNKNIIVHESVYCDLLRIARDEKFPDYVKKARAIFYARLISLWNMEINQFAMTHSDKQKKIILEANSVQNRNLGKMKNWADSLLKKLAEEMKIKEHVFLVSDDRGLKKQVSGGNITKQTVNLFLDQCLKNIN